MVFLLVNLTDFYIFVSIRVLLRSYYDEKIVCFDEARKLDTKKYYLRFSCAHENKIIVWVSVSVRVPKASHPRLPKSGLVLQNMFA